MFIGLNKLHCDVLFENDKYYVLFMNSTALQDQTHHSDATLEKLAERASKLLPVSTYFYIGQWFAPRHPRYMVVGKKGAICRYIEKEDLPELEKAALSTGWDSYLNEFVSIVKNHQRKRDTVVSVGELFFVASVKDGKFDFNHTTHAPIIQDYCAGTFELTDRVVKISFPEIIKKQTDSPADYQITGYCAANEFECIALPGHTLSVDDLKFLKSRENLRGRICRNYVILPYNKRIARRIRVRSLPNFTIDEMLQFFGCNKKNQTKVDTLTNCLRHLAQKYSTPDVGERMFIELNTAAGKEDTFNNIVPMDSILTQASHLRVLASEAVDINKTRMLVETTKEEVDDFARHLYTTLEAKRGPVKIYANTGSQMNNVVEELRKELSVYGGGRYE
jgi:hypothetical protein